jgi:hypothetical protein
VRSRKFAAIAAISAAGAVLAATGAYACISPAGGSSPQITTQTLSVVLSASGATGNGTPNITLGSLGLVGSSFMTPPTLITITNNGTMTASEVALKLSDQNNNATFQNETWVCLYKDGNVLVNEPLKTVEGYGVAAIGHLSLAPKATDSFTADYYAGPTENTGCGKTFSGFSPIPINGYLGQYATTEPYPSGTVNTAALSLTNPAEGGRITPTVTISFVGVAGIITQIAPFGKTVTRSNCGSNFEDQLAVTGSSGGTTYTVTSPNFHLKVTNGGSITTVGGPLAVGTYTVSGTDSDPIGDTGTWTYTLTVIKGTLTQVASFGKTVTIVNSGASYGDQLNVSGTSGATTYVVTSSNSHLKVSSSGAITTVSGPLTVGIYTVSGTDTDSLGDTGTWTYTLTVIKGTLTQVAPFGKTVTIVNSGGSYNDQLTVSGSSGATTYVVTSSNAHLKVLSSGVITTVSGPLAAGTYTVSGTDSDSLGDIGTWTYTLTVIKGTLTQVAPFGKTVTIVNSGASYGDQLAVSGSSGATAYVVTSSNSHLKVSSNGAITSVSGPLAVGAYTVSGTDSDSLGDTGTWTYTLTVIKGTLTQVAPFSEKVTVAKCSSGFSDQLAVSGSSGSTTYLVTSSNAHLKVSSSGLVTTVSGPLAAGNYTVSGTDSDSLGDTGTWTYTLTVT